MIISAIFDPHLSDKSPETRKDNYKEAILSKLSFIIERANRNNHKAILIAGDVFHRKIPSHNSHGLISTLITLFNSSKVPIYVVVGNHDISGNLENLKQQPIYVLEKAGVIKILDDSDPVILQEENFKVSINGKPFSVQKDNKENVSLYNLNHEDSSNCKIGMFHQMLLEDGQTFFSEYINVSDLLGVNSDIIINGHYHVGFNPPVIPINEKYFINGGSLSRGSSDSFNLEKQPSYQEITLTDNLSGGFNLLSETVVVPHTPANEAFDTAAVTRRKEVKEIKEFIANLSEFEAESLSSSTPDGIILNLKLMEMPEKLLSLAENYLNEAYERIN